MSMGFGFNYLGAPFPNGAKCYLWCPDRSGRAQAAIPLGASIGNAIGLARRRQMQYTIYGEPFGSAQDKRSRTMLRRLADNRRGGDNHGRTG